MLPLLSRSVRNVQGKQAGKLGLLNIPTIAYADACEASSSLKEQGPSKEGTGLRARGAWDMLRGRGLGLRVLI